MMKNDFFAFLTEKLVASMKVNVDVASVSEKELTQQISTPAN